MEWGTPIQWGRFLLFCVPQSVKTEETKPTRMGSPTPCKQALSYTFYGLKCGTFTRSLFFHCRSLSPCIGGRQHFSFCHHRYKIVMLSFQQKMSPLFFISRYRSLSPLISLSFALRCSCSRSFNFTLFTSNSVHRYKV